MKLVILESPYAGDIPANEAYARACMADCLRRGEAPFASHLLYTQPGVLDDAKPDERRLGLVADRLGRNAVLIELNPTYAEMAARRLRTDGGMFMSVSVDAQMEAAE